MARFMVWWWCAETCRTDRRETACAGRGLPTTVGPGPAAELHLNLRVAPAPSYNIGPRQRRPISRRRDFPATGAKASHNAFQGTLSGRASGGPHIEAAASGQKLPRPALSLDDARKPADRVDPPRREPASTGRFRWKMARRLAARLNRAPISPKQLLRKLHVIGGPRAGRDNPARGTQHPGYG